MQYCVIEDGIITNIIISDEEFATSIGAKPIYEGATIGEPYAPPDPPVQPTLEERVTALENAIAKGFNL